MVLRKLLWALCAFMLLWSCSRKVIPTVRPDLLPAVINPDTIELLSAEAHRQQEIADSMAQPHVIIALKRSGCFGQCPVFEAQVISDGSATYRGMRYVEREGLYKTTASDDWIANVLRQAQDIKFLEFSNIYPQNRDAISDLPETITIIQIGYQQKIVRDNYDAPEALEAFERFLEKEFEKLDWKPVNK